jgi:predicted ATPase/class 3 adenylate cyclase
MAVCRSCRSELPPAARFCPSCGVAVEAPPGTEERKVVSVLFADLVDSTERGDRQDPEDTRATLRLLHTRLREELERFGGTMEKFIGDAAMALFGAPVAHEDDAERAVRAALAVQEAASALEDEFRFRIGVATGEAVVDLTARPREGEGMAAGDIMNTAFRIAEAAPPEGIFVDDTTYWATRDSVEYTEVEPVTAKGKAEPLQVWRVVGARDAGRRLPTPFVGRRAEIEQLLAALERAEKEQAPSLVTIVGVPGIGKTRLVSELADLVAAREPEPLWLQGRALSYGEETAFWALGEMVRTLAGILRTDAPEATDEKLRRVLEAALPDETEADRAGDYLRPLVGLAASSHLRGNRRSEAFAAWRRFLEGLARDRPAVLVFEDLHWADEGLLEFVDHLAGRSTVAPLVLICTARRELLDRHPGWGGGHAGSELIELAPLSSAQTVELAAGLLGQDRIPGAVEAALTSRAEGNALYAEEFARMLVDRGLLRRSTEGWELEHEQLPVPESVQAIIAARIDALPADEKSLLQEAAVVGRACWVGALEALNGLPRYVLDERLRALDRKEFLRREPRSAVAEETQYAFRHVLVRDVAYSQIPRLRRAEAHRAAAEWIEALAPEREDQIDLLAHHYLSALELAHAAGVGSEELAERARLALRDAGDRATELNAFGSAARLYDEALRLWPEIDEDYAQVRFCLGKALFQLGTGADTLAAARVELLERGDTASAAEAEALLGVLVHREGRSEEALEHVEQAVSLLEAEPVSTAKAQVLAMLAGVLLDEKLARDALVMAEELEADELTAHALSTLGFARGTSGDFGGLEDLERAVEVAPADSFEHIRALSLLASLLAHKGELARSVALSQEALDAAAKFGSPTVIRFLEAERVAGAYWNGQWEAALELADDFADAADAGLRHYGEILCRQVRAQIRLARGDVDGALEDAEKGLAAARTTADPQSLFPALAVQAWVLCRAGRRDEAGSVVDELLEGFAGSSGTATFWFADLAVVLAALDRTDELRVLEQQASGRTGWLEAALAYAADPSAAAELYATIGTRPAEADARVRAATRLLNAGERQRAEQELGKALAFYRDVGATAYELEAQALLATV